MLQTLKNAWATKEIKSKILFTCLILLLYRIGTVIPVPFVDTNNFASVFSGTILDYMNVLSGGSLEVATLFALGVQPYINASIIIQLLCVAFPRLGELNKDEAGKKKMNTITRVTTIGIALITALGYFLLLKQNHFLTIPEDSAITWLYAVVIIACYCAGASLIMWLAERINERGIGNGISIILFANIVSSIPSKAYMLGVFAVSCFQRSDNPALRGIFSIVFDLALIAIALAFVIFVIWVTGSERRIPIYYAKQQKGRKMYGGQSQNLPIKLNMVGVMPVIFASSLASVIPTFLMLFGVTSAKSVTDGTPITFWNRFYDFLAPEGWFYPVIMFLMIVFFTYFYTTISFNPREIANNLKRQGGTISGIRQGRPTADYITKILSKVTIVGALFLSIVAIVPIVGGPHVLKPLISLIIGNENSAATLSNSFTFGGTTLLIVVGVVLETFRGIEAQLTMRNHKNLF